MQKYVAETLYRDRIENHEVCMGQVEFSGFEISSGSVPIPGHCVITLSKTSSL